MRSKTWIVLAVASFLWGLAAGEYRIFPYQQVRAVKNALDGEDGSRDPRLYVGSPHAVTVGLGDRVWGTKADVAMVGDSITAGGRWHEMFPDVKIVNRGVGGDTVGGVKGRLSAIQEVEADKIFLMIGTNDVLFDNPEDIIIQQYSGIIEAFGKPGPEVYVQSILLCGAMELCTRVRRERTVKLNRQLAALAKSRDATFIDLNVHLADEDGLRPEFTWDGLHLNGAGYARWRDILAPYMVVQDSSPVQAD
jgi:lysophospholipase L1-like esterase